MAPLHTTPRRHMFAGSSFSSPAPPKREISSLEDDEDYLDRPRKKIFTTNPVPPPFVKRRDFAYGHGAAERIREGIDWANEVQRREEEREAEARRRRDESVAKYQADMHARQNQLPPPPQPSIASLLNRTGDVQKNESVAGK
ncbi:hypothetical protein RhiJN_28426 [Ceratobasidium sp. AG-Ba]|nr:hypothetical protein RhiJN_14374 [Ceratobasidium sp. AG-Ba]QRW00408.1 hypothetical protein RhiJN_28426 [Ceratobasidium sp. AG-Ba]